MSFRWNPMFTRSWRRGRVTGRELSPVRRVRKSDAHVRWAIHDKFGLGLWLRLHVRPQVQRKRTIETRPAPPRSVPPMGL